MIDDVIDNEIDDVIDDVIDDIINNMIRRRDDDMFLSILINWDIKSFSISKYWLLCEQGHPPMRLCNHSKKQHVFELDLVATCSARFRNSK